MCLKKKTKCSAFLCILLRITLSTFLSSLFSLFLVLYALYSLIIFVFLFYILIFIFHNFSLFISLWLCMYFPYPIGFQVEKLIHQNKYVIIFINKIKQKNILNCIIGCWFFVSSSLCFIKVHCQNKRYTYFMYFYVFLLLFNVIFFLGFSILIKQD